MSPDAPSSLLLGKGVDALPATLLARVEGAKLTGMGLLGSMSAAVVSMGMGSLGSVSTGMASWATVKAALWQCRDQ